tara:strand:+ start:436 stop:771 length:336 start_codon:yes stop_codon:yes gene_type:complete
MPEHSKEFLKRREAAQRYHASSNGLWGGGGVGFLLWISVWMALTETTSRPWAKGFQLEEQLLIGVVFILVGGFIGRLYGAYKYEKNKDRNQYLEKLRDELEDRDEARKRKN